MKAFYEAVFKDLHKNLTVEDILLKSQTSRNPIEQRVHDFVQHCKIVTSEMHRVQPQEEVIAGD